MDKQEFLKQMVTFGQKLLEEEEKKTSQLDVDAIKCLQRLYDSLAEAVNAAADLEVHFKKNKDKRVKRVSFAIGQIMSAQDIMNPLAEDEDIQLV